jgi:hypothetical protein
MSINGAGTVSIPSGGFLDLSSEIRVGNIITRNIVVNLPISTTTNNCVQFASWIFNNAISLDIMITVPSTNFGVAKRYIATITYNQTNASWHKIFPISATTNYYPLNTQDFDINIKISNNSCVLRLIRTFGTIAGTAYITILYSGNTNDPFNATQVILTDTLPTALLSSANTGMFGGGLYTETVNTLGNANSDSISCNNTITTNNLNCNSIYLNSGSKLLLFNTANTYKTSLAASPSLSASYTLYLPPTVGTNGQALMTDGAGTLSWTPFANISGAFYGNGSDGDVTVLAGAGVQIARDMYYNNLTINDFVVCGSAGQPVYRVFVKNTLTINAGGAFGIFSDVESPPQNGSVGGGGGGGYLSAGTSLTNALGGNGGVGANTTYAGGIANIPTAAEGGLKAVNIVANAVQGRSSSGLIYTGGAGGGSSPYSGQYIRGGAGNGVLIVCAKIITGLETNGAFLAYGSGGYAGGGGGGGGAVIIVSSTNLAQYSMASRINVSGGPKGNLYSGSQPGTAGRYFIIQT